MISKRFVQYFDMCWSAIEKACKNTFVLSTAVCLCMCVHLCVCSYPIARIEETSPEGYPFSPITLMKLVERDGQRAFSVRAVGVLQIVRGYISPCKTPPFLSSDSRAKDVIFYARPLYLTQTAPSKQQHDCVLSYLFVWRAYVFFFFPFSPFSGCVWACSCLCQDIFKVEQKHFDPPSTAPLS